MTMGADESNVHHKRRVLQPASRLLADWLHFTLAELKVTPHRTEFHTGETCVKTWYFQDVRSILQRPSWPN